MYAYPNYNAQSNWSIIESSSDKLKAMPISFGTDFKKFICRRWTTGKNGDLQQKKNLREGNLVWLAEDSDKQGY